MIALILFATLSFPPSPPTPMLPPLSPETLDLYRIAGKAAGEARVLGPMGVYLVASTIVNRMEQGATLDEAMSFYYAPVLYPFPWEIEEVKRALQDPYRGIIYAFSRPDVNRLGFDPSTADVSTERGGWAIFFWSEWPGQ